MYRVRGPVALLIYIAEENPPQAPSQDQSSAQSRRPAADNQNINIHEVVLQPPFAKGPFTPLRSLLLRGQENMPPASAPALKDLTPEERRERRALRREKQRDNNILRASKMHKARLKLEAERRKIPPASLRERLYWLLGLALLEMARQFL
jgi:hypothetical protein